ncbi:hypothetical protein BCR41DRAFT_356925 [Lobosporangium transversale]|uniref:Aminoacyl-transfer RNA synthetases class-II family profile domain-containing protein n=1 Tax=Lobosporangium transversale TaxID=64571 RepID=A0A1Y2GKS8_9FUNG|nr:hypothetical protein BCR41DRAFT_356925 [Lobosporangium transversale]ORZ11787.1 hypothetical protein BCR41DRAFT_356925 [Lobosporangium transversale]|eukprot:XP_021879884.1 hypothetical protein BCR41DRAFT_356925 [Lobosporangium transversale]
MFTLQWRSLKLGNVPSVLKTRSAIGKGQLRLSKWHHILGYDRPLEETCQLELIPFQENNDRLTSLFWHSSAHVLGMSLEAKYGPRLLLCDGPSIKQGENWIGIQNRQTLTRIKLKLKRGITVLFGKNQGLFATHPTSPGSAFMLPHGTRIVEKLMRFMRQQYRKYGFEEVMTPLMYKKELWETSGHWQNYKDDMFQPMNCPGHCLIFDMSNRSYKDLPIRYADFSALHRYAAIISFKVLLIFLVLYDAHIFYWNAAEDSLRQALDQSGLSWSVNEGDGAFYGPKIDILVKDALGRRHQTATIQLDFQLPQRFGLVFQDQKGEKQTPVIVHRAVLGSVERMMAILIEHTGGRWPFWISPRQAMVVPVTGNSNSSDEGYNGEKSESTTNHGESLIGYAAYVKETLAKAGRTPSNTSKYAIGKQLETGKDPVVAMDDKHYFVDIDQSGGTLNKMVRDAQVAQYNFILVIGEKEKERCTVNVRTREGER